MEALSEESSWTTKQQRTKKYISNGELGKAMTTVATPDVISTLTIEQQLQVLQDKHPGAQWLQDQREEVHELEEVVVDPDCIIKATMVEVRDVIRRARRCFAHGLDMTRYEHMKQLVGLKPEPDPCEVEFCNLLTDFINCLLAGEVPFEVLPAFRYNHLLGLPKGDTDLRPIGMGSLYRKIASTIAFKHTVVDFNPKYFNTLQLALTRGGCEQIVHAFQTHIEMHPDHDVFAIDADNAFNSANRLKGLSEILDNYPSLFPLMRDMYLHPSQGFVFGHPTGIKYIVAEEGLHQGDVLGTWGYIMTIQPMLEGLSTMVRSEFGDEMVSLVKFYVDDGNIAAPHHIMVRIIEFLKTEGPKYGYKIKATKGKYLVGVCESYQAAQVRKQHLMQLGLSESIIVLHPQNDTTVAECDYGLKILGSYVGRPPYIKKMLQVYGDELSREADCLISYPDFQGRWQMFLRCFTKKPLYIFRTISPVLTHGLQQQFEALKKKVLKSLLAFRSDEEISDVVYSTCNFGIQQGGLGLHLSAEVATAAFVSSMIAFLQSTTGEEQKLQQLILEKIDNPDYPLCSYLNSFRLAVFSMQIPFPDQHPDKISQMKYV